MKAACTAILLALASLGAGPGAAATGTGEPLVYSVTLDDAIHPISARFLKQAIAKANEDEVSLLIIRLNTPGGLQTSMEDIIGAITASQVPVVVFVHGSKAASAGFFITIAADVAVMAPGTRMGAAHPVAVTGEIKQDSPMMAKMENDAAAYARSLAENRDRNADEAEKAVRDSSAFTEREALELNLIDYICNDEAEILQVLDGETIRRFDGSEDTLHLAGARVESIDMSAADRFLSVLANPGLAAVLLLVGLLGLYIEFTHPGMIAPGLIGAVCLLLFAFATQTLPVNWVGLALVVLGIVMFILEIKVVSYGFLALGGIACLIVGSLILFKDVPDIPGMAAARSLITSVSILVGIVMAVLTFLVARVVRARSVSGASGLLSEVGTASTDLDPEGRVFVHGEYWNARSARPIRKGSRVHVIGVHNLLLEVEEDN